jgi:hypothetical protein
VAILSLPLFYPFASEVFNAGGWDLEVESIKKLGAFFKTNPTRLHGLPGCVLVMK